jgi:hypothetical protein
LVDGQASTVARGLSVAAVHQLPESPRWFVKGH